MDFALNFNSPESNVFHVIMDALYDGVYCTNRDRQITYWNPAAEQLTGFSSDEVVGHSCADNILQHVSEDGCNICQGKCPLKETINDGKKLEILAYMHHKEGHRVPVYIRTSPLIDNGHIVGGIEIFSNASMVVSLRLTNQRLKKMAFLDELTQLPNRRYGMQKIEEAAYDLNRYGNNYGIIIFDIDNFKNVNDLYGHDEGDKIIRMTGASLQMGARESDFVCRWGGEEFIGIINEATEETILTIAERQRLLVEKSYINGTEFPGGKLGVTVSCGAAISQKDANIKDLIAYADDALYDSKTNGKNQVTFYGSTKS